MSEIDFLSLDATTTKNALANKKLTALLVQVAKEAGFDQSTPVSKNMGNLLYMLASKFPPAAERHRAFLARCCGDNRVDTQIKLDAAVQFFKKVGSENFDEKEFNEAAGVGVNLNNDEVNAAVSKGMEAMKEEILAQRYRVSISKILTEIKVGPLRFADGKTIKEAVDKKLEAMLGPKTEADLAKPTKPTKPEATVETEKKSEERTGPAREHQHLPTPTDNLDHTTDTQRNKPEILKKHLEETGGKYITRFPPEPNGYLHLGHAKAMFLDFGLAVQQGGGCNLRYDDTNPEAESQEYMDSIVETVHWLGHKPRQVTYSSDQFERLYELAVELIKRGKAYICHQTSEQMAKAREEKTASPWRDRPMAESLKLFEDMRKGKMAEGECTLRMKQDITSPNPNMWDLVAYRVKYCAHPHTGDKWCIYPSYDYSHCIIDSLENITHSLCTLEFQSRHESYMWLLDVLDLYRPHVWEFSRLELSHTMLSKRKLTILVNRKFVRGWDDPRMPTLVGLRRRGYSAKTINRFCEEIGVTRRGVVTHSIGLLEQVCRNELDEEASRAFAVLNPLKVVIANWTLGDNVTVSAPCHPRYDAMGVRTIPFTSTIYIDSSDFRMVDAKDYYGLAPNKVVALKYASKHIRCVEVKQDADGAPVELQCEFVEVSSKVKGVLHWAPANEQKEPLMTAEVRQYETLFKSAKAGGETNDWMDDLNPTSETILTAAIEPSLASAAVGSRFQFERVGFYVVDKDSTPNHRVFNRIVTMKDSYGTAPLS